MSAHFLSRQKAVANGKLFCLEFEMATIQFAWRETAFGHITICPLLAMCFQSQIKLLTKVSKRDFEEFVARYKINGRANRPHEIGRFGRWWDGGFMWMVSYARPDPNCFFSPHSKKTLTAAT